MSTTPPPPPGIGPSPQQPYPGAPGPELGPPGLPGPWGQPAEGAPPPRRDGKVVAVIVASLLGVVILGRAMYQVWGPSVPSKPPPTPVLDITYKVTLPKQLEAGKFKLAEDMSESAAREVPGARAGDQAYMAQYTATSGSDQLLYMGVNSRHAGSGPGGWGDSMLDGMEDGPATEVAVERRRIISDGTADPLSCEVLTSVEQGQKVTLPVCAWSDPGSAAAITDLSSENVTADPEDVDLEALAARVDTIRDEIRAPAD